MSRDLLHRTGRCKLFSRRWPEVRFFRHPHCRCQFDLINRVFREGRLTLCAGTGTGMLGSSTADRKCQIVKLKRKLAPVWVGQGRVSLQFGNRRFPYRNQRLSLSLSQRPAALPDQGTGLTEIFDPTDRSDRSLASHMCVLLGGDEQNPRCAVKKVRRKVESNL